MTIIELEIKIKECIEDITGTKVNEIKNSHTLEELQIDSLYLIEITMEIEQDFSIQITDEKLENIETIQDFIDLIFEEISKK